MSKIPIQNVISLIEKLIISPNQFWKDRKDNGFKVSPITMIIIPLVFISALVAFIGNFIWSEEFLFNYAIGLSIREILSYSIMFIISCILILKLANNFGYKKESSIIYNLIAYSIVPVLLIAIITYFLPVLSPIKILGVYSFYLFYKGAEICMEIPKENVSKFTSLSILILIFVSGTLYWTTWLIFKKILSHGI